MLQESCIDLFDDMNCANAVNFCDAEMSAPLWATGKNVYDISKVKFEAHITVIA